jgi:hypothetical protein
MRFTFSKISGIELLTKAKKMDIILSTAALKEYRVESFYAKFKAALINFSNYLTTPNTKIDNLQQNTLIRAEYCKAFFCHLENYMCYPDKEISNQVKHLLEITTKLNKDFKKKCCKMETGILQTAIGRIELEHKELLIKINAEKWFDLLKKAQIDFKKSLAEVTIRHGMKPELDLLLNSRSMLVDSIQKLYDSIELHYQITENQDCKTALNAINNILNC